jgi:hypothetical protein
MSVTSGEAKVGWLEGGREGFVLAWYLVGLGVVIVDSKVWLDLRNP